MRKALVTGGNRGIGYAICQGLADLGYSVLLGSRDPEPGKKAAAQMNGVVTSVELDLSNRQVMMEQLGQILRNHGDIEILVNNAGILMHGDFLEVDPKDMAGSMNVNFWAPFYLIRQLVPVMSERGYGRIVNISSGLGAFAEGLNGPAAYSISKAALNAITLSVAGSVPEYIKVNSMCPGWVATRMGGANAPRTPDKGAETAIWLATLPDHGPTGGFYRDMTPISW